jgi:hypothetical protein
MKAFKSLTHCLKRYIPRLLLTGFVALIFTIANSPIAAPAFAASDQTSGQATVKDSTSSDLSDIPNLEQMNHDSLERYFGDTPAHKKPLFNPDNGKNEHLQDPDSNKTVRIKDLKNQPEEKQ